MCAAGLRWLTAPPAALDVNEVGAPEPPDQRAGCARLQLLWFGLLTVGTDVKGAGRRAPTQGMEDAARARPNSGRAGRLLVVGMAISGSVKPVAAARPRPGTSIVFAGWTIPFASLPRRCARVVWQPDANVVSGGRNPRALESGEAESAPTLVSRSRELEI